MLETWEEILSPYTPNVDEQNEDTIELTFSEPSIRELKDMMNARPIEDGY
jgi:hypothetical protein